LEWENVIKGITSPEMDLHVFSQTNNMIKDLFNCRNRCVE